MVPGGRCPGAGSAGQPLPGEAGAVPCHTQPYSAIPSWLPATHTLQGPAGPCSQGSAASGKMDLRKSKTLPGSEGKK